MPQYPGLSLRPYQLLCAVCSLGDDAGMDVQSTDSIIETVRLNPDMPVTLRCNAGDVFVYQDPGPADDTPGGTEFNIRRDLEILHKLNLFPGCTLPARILFHRLLERIDEVSGICGYDAVTAEAWKGCPKAGCGSYLRGREKGIHAICPPRRECDLVEEKAKSLEAMHEAGAVRVRPHILLCALCQYGGGIRPPYPEDNLPELLQLILKEPDTLITMAPYADWMMCAPCPMRAPELNACVHNKGAGGLSNEMRDLRVLQKLGLTYGSTIEARDLYRLIFERISGTLEICRLEHSAPSVWYTGCGSAETDSTDFEKGRAQFMADLGCRDREQPV